MNIFGLGTPELILIVVVLLLFFGKDRLPGLARGIGESVRELRDGLTKGLDDEKERAGSGNLDSGASGFSA
jgi:sec-independent protein translocase protein TatA